MQSVFKLIDEYPDFTTFFLISLALFFQIIIGNDIRTLILTTSLMLPSFVVILPTNIFMKKVFKVKRPEKYYKVIKWKSVFEGSFPSFHSQFSAGEATTFVLGIYLFTPRKILFVAILLASCIAVFSPILVATSRVKIGMHYLADVIGGILFGIVTGICVVSCVGRFWEKIPLQYHIAMIVVFVVTIFVLSRNHRKSRMSGTNLNKNKSKTNKIKIS